MSDPAAMIGAIARRVLGEPNKVHSTARQLRFGTNGSVAVEIVGDKAGSWYDHENRIGGGPSDLVSLKAGIPESQIDAWLDREFFRSEYKGRQKARQQR